MSTVDVNREFHKLWGKVDICGIEMKAAEVLAEVNPEAYEAAIENYGIGQGYYHCPDRGEWFESYQAMIEFNGEMDAAEYVFAEERERYVG